MIHDFFCLPEARLASWPHEKFPSSGPASCWSLHDNHHFRKLKETRHEIFDRLLFLNLLGFASRLPI
jgi:hypothetical protein